jgi:hypothetical protein
MRILFAASLAGVAMVSLAACNKPAASAAGGDSSAVAANAAAPAGPLSADQIPHRKPGLWKQSISMDGGPEGPGAMQLCVDAASEAKTSIAAQHIPGATCTTPQFTRNLDGSITITNACDMGANGKSQTTGTIKGDFNSSYTATMATTMTGGPVASMNGAHTMVLTGTYVGPCAPGEVGGDMIMADGTKMNALANMPAAAPSGGQ